MADRLSKEAGAGHNQGVDPNTFLDSYRQLIEADRVLSEAQSARSLVLKRAKKAGVDLSALKELRALSRLDDDVVAMRFRTLAKYSEWIGRPLGFQTELFGATDDQRPSDEAASKLQLSEDKQQGYTDATHNSPVDNCPHHAGSDRAAAWTEGWHLGRKFMVDSGKLTEQEQTGRPRAGAARRRSRAAQATDA